jgi:hypothetical protein
MVMIKDKYYRVYSNNEYVLLDEVHTLTDLAKYIFEHAVKVAGFSLRKKGKKAYMEYMKAWSEGTVSYKLTDMDLCVMVSNNLVNRYAYYYKTPGRYMNNRNYKAIIHKVERHCQKAMGYSYAEAKIQIRKERYGENYRSN